MSVQAPATLVAALRAAPSTACLTLLVARPGLRPAVQEALASVWADTESLANAVFRPWAMPRWMGLEGIDDGFLHRARGPRDVPRSRLQRVEQLAALLESTRLGSTTAPLSARAARQLASEWVSLFQSWDFRLAAQGLRPCDIKQSSLAEVPDAASVLSMLAPVYTAAHDPTDLAFWLIDHPPDPAESVLLLSVGAASEDARAVAQVAWQGRVQCCSFPAFPEAFGLAPDDSPIEHRRQALARLAPLLAATEAKTTEQAARWALSHLAKAHAQQQSVALLGTDRLLLRRLHALAREAGLPIHDPSGYGLITSVASTAVLGLLQAVWPVRDANALAAWLSHPWVMALTTVEPEWLNRGLAQWHRQRARRVLLSDEPPLPTALGNALASLQRLSRTHQSPKQWLLALEHCVDVLGLLDRIQDDEAGVCVWSALQSMCAQMGHQSVSCGQFVSLAQEALREGSLPLPSPNAFIRVCSLEEAAASEANEVLVLGAAAGQFPPMASARLADPTAEASLYGALSPSDELALMLGALGRVLDRGARLHFLGVRVSPELPLAWSRLVERLLWLAGVLPGVARGQHPSEAVAPPSPIVPAAASAGASAGAPAGASHAGSPSSWVLPPRVTVGQLVSFATCPKQFEWRVLEEGVNAPSLMPEASHPELGQLLHALMDWLGDGQLLANEPSLADRPEELLLAFGRARGMNIPAGLRAPLLQRVQPAARWVLAQAARGVSLVRSEGSYQTPLPTLGVGLVGVPDRIDQCAGQWRIVDFKSGSVQSLKPSKYGPSAGALQLQLYAEMLSSQDCAEPPQKPFNADVLVLVSMRRDGFQEVPVDRSPGLLATLESNIHSALRAQHFPATGRATTAGKACAVCPAAGVCRS